MFNYYGLILVVIGVLVVIFPNRVKIKEEEDETNRASYILGFFFILAGVIVFLRFVQGW